MAVALRTALLLAVLLLLAVPGQAAAKEGCSQAQAPPGNSEIDQYAEGIPGSCGKDRFDPSAAGSVPTGPAGGSDAAAAEAFSRATAPGIDAQSGSKAQREDPEGTSALGGISEAAAGRSEGGMGLWLPLILVAAVAAAIGAGLLRWRGRRAG